jgi:acyl-CoA thioesterase FadM
MSTPVDIDEKRASFGLKQEAWSLNQRAVVARCESVQVMYDFENLKKGKMTPEVREALESIASRSRRS